MRNATLANQDSCYLKMCAFASKAQDFQLTVALNVILVSAKLVLLITYIVNTVKKDSLNLIILVYAMKEVLINMVNVFYVVLHFVSSAKLIFKLVIDVKKG